MAGTPQLHGFVDPVQEPGVVLVEATGEDGEVVQAPAKLAVAAVEPVSVAVPLAEVARLDDLEEHLVRLGSELVERSPGGLVVARVVLEGVGRLRAALVDPATRARLLTALRRHGPAPTPGGESESLCWWADLVLAPLPGPAAAPLMRRNRLADEAVRLGGRARAAGPDTVMAAAWAELDGRPGPAAPPGAVWAGVVMEATSVVLDLLDGERPCG
jgi:hypothetical protein